MSGTRSFSQNRRIVLAMAALAVFLLLAIVADVVLAVLLSRSGYGNQYQENVTNGIGVESKNRVCLTKDCIALASRILQNMDTSVDPCEDFYLFSCGGWIDQNVLLRDKSSLTITDVMQDNALLKLKRLLEADVMPSERSYIKKAKDYYASCVNQEHDTRGYRPIVDLITVEFGGWSLIDDKWDKYSFDTEAMVAKASNHYVSTVCTLSVTVDYRDGKTRVLKLDQPTFILGERQEANNPEKLKEYRKIMADMAAIFGINNNTVTETQIDRLLEFERNLSMIAAVMPFGTDNPFAISRMQERYLTSAFDWKKYFVTVTSSPEIGITNLTDDEIIFRGPNSYFLALKTLLLNTSKRTLSNFIVWRVILAYKQILDFTNLDPNRPRLVTMLPDNEMICLESMAIYNNMKYATNRLYAQNTLGIADQIKIADMFQRVQAAFNKTLDELDWLDETEKQILKEKNGNVKLSISYWERLYNNSVLDGYYFNMTFHQQTYLENVVSLNKQSYNAMVRELRISNDPDSMWFFLPIIVNAFFDKFMNSIEFSEAIFQSPIYNKDFPNYINYGGIGSTFGHELTHGFDSVGITYNKEGAGGFQWNQSFTEKFSNKTKCLVDQYSSFFVLEANETINGTTSLDENMADNSGIKLSFKAFEELERTAPSQKIILPGINYSDHQLFFISFAQRRCHIVIKDKLIQQLSSPYSPEKYRMIGPLQNSVDFAEAFRCPVGSFMNPADKCIVY